GETLVGEREIVVSLDRRQLILRRSFANEQGNRVPSDIKLLKQAPPITANLLEGAGLASIEMQGTMQEEDLGTLLVPQIGISQVKVSLIRCSRPFSPKEILENLRLIHDRPVQQQVVVGRVHIAVGGQDAAKLLLKLLRDLIIGDVNFF